MTTKILIPSGVLGLGFDDDALEKGLSYKPDAIAIDGGSTDSGAYYLGTSSSKYSRDICKDEWQRLMIARHKANIPLIIGSSGTCGSDDMVDLMCDITKEIASKHSQKLKIAKIYCEQQPKNIAVAYDNGKIAPLYPAPNISHDDIVKMQHIVAVAGAEQIIAALKTNADIILAGRTSDTANIAALALMNGEHQGASWHGAKIAECGAFCTTNPKTGVVMVTFDKTGFSVEAMSDKAICTREKVAAHMLYENANPLILHEPGGYLDASNAKYHDTGNGKIRVEGSQWIDDEHYKIKLEGAIISGYQTTMMAILRDQHYVDNAQLWLKKLQNFIHVLIRDKTHYDIEMIDCDFRLIGINAALGDIENKKSTPCEIGVLLMITAPTQHIATEISKLINPFLLHYPLDDNEALPTFAFPYSPAHSERGALYEFALHHTIEIAKPMDIFKLETENI